MTEHKAIIQADQYLLEEEKELLLYVDTVNHNIEQYVTRMEMIVSQKVERLSKFKGQYLSLVLWQTARFSSPFLSDLFGKHMLWYCSVLACAAMAQTKHKFPLQFSKWK